MKKLAVILTLVLVITLLSSVLCEPAHAVFLEDGVPTDLYAVSIDNHNIYQINPLTGSVTTVSTTTLFPSIGAAFDGTFLYYWNAQGSNRGIGRWNPLTDTHILFNDTDISEENADVSADGTLWLLDRTYSKVDGALQGDNTGDLLNIDKTTGARTIHSSLPLGGIQGFAAGDIAWGPDGRLYISTINALYGWDDSNNYIWDPFTTTLSKMPGSYHAGLVWLGDKLYGSKTLRGGTGAVFEVDPTNFSDIRQAAIMPAGVTIGDLSTTIPEPTTIALLGLGSLALLRKRRVYKTQFTS